MKIFKIAVFASGHGSNFQAIIERFHQNSQDLKLELLVSDNPSAYAITRASEAGIPAFVFNPKDFKNRKDYEELILKELLDREIDLVVLAGFMRVLSDVLVVPFYGRIINIHPSLLPSFKGVASIEEALNYGVKITGATVHFVDSGLDSGPIIAQKSVEILEGDTLESLKARIQKVEHALLTDVIQWLSEGILQLEGRKVRVLSAKRECSCGY